MEFLSSHFVPHYDTFLFRIVVSTILGFAIGFEREITSKFAGLRTHILVCVGSTIFTILSIYAFPTATADGNPVAYGDPARIAAQVLTGIGFIGGGTVLRHGPSVMGLTTAATLWISASIGMAVGTGAIMLGALGTGVTLVVLVLIRYFEVHFMKKIAKNDAKVRIELEVKSSSSGKVIESLKENFDYMTEIRHESDSELDKITFISRTKGIKDPTVEVYDKLKEIDNINKIHLTNLNFE